MENVEQYHHALLGWFEKNKAELPWRSSQRDPYHVWLAEIMLQQTQVVTVIPYFERFLEQFPTFSALANAPLDTVLKQWEGLGYYSRARNLHKAAQKVIDELDGLFPESVEGLKQLPGVGEYTAGAIASLAFNVDAPVVDGNVIRVLSRLFDVEDDVTEAGTRNYFWQLTEDILPEGQAGAWNEALMDLGRIICTPKSPDCTACPLADLCAANRLGIQELRPVKKKRKPTPHYDMTAAVIQDEGRRYLIAQRPLDGLLGGLWEFPGGQRNEDESLREAVRRSILENIGLQIEVGPQTNKVKHAFTHFKITRYVFRCEYISGDPQPLQYERVAWATARELGSDYAMPVTDQKILNELQGGGQLGFGI